MIELDGDSEIKIISVDIKTLPVGWLKRFVDNVQPEYRDQVMKEHLYAIGSINGENEDNYDDWTPTELEILHEIYQLMNENNAAYVRFVNP